MLVQGDFRGFQGSMATVTDLTIESPAWDALFVQCQGALFISRYAEAETACLEALRLNRSLGENESFRSLIVMAYLGLDDVTAARNLVLQVGGSEYEGLAVAASLTPEELPAGFTLTQLQESSRGIIYKNLHLQDLAKQHQVKASIEARFVDLTRTSAIVTNAVTEYSTEDAAAEGFVFQSNPQTYDAWAVIAQPPGTDVTELEEAAAPRIGEQSVRYRGKLSSMPGLVMESDVIVFRYANVVSIISVDHPTRLAPPLQALELAQIQAQRIKDSLAAQ